MKISYLIIPAFIIALSVPLRSQWTIPLQITKGPSNDVHPAFENRLGYSGIPEWLAFTRVGTQGSDICVMQTETELTTWKDTVYQITGDSTENDYASLAMLPSMVEGNITMLAWQRTSDVSNIYYALNNGLRWLNVTPLTQDSVTNLRPVVASGGATFGITWERGGQIAFEEYNGNSWDSVQLITNTPRPINFSPRLQYWYPNPVILWEQVKEPDTTRAIMYSLRTSSGWTAPDTLAWTGDNRDPAFGGFEGTITWDSKRDSDWDVYGTTAYSYGNQLVYYGVVDISNNPRTEDHLLSTTMTPFITSQRPMSTSRIIFDAAVWHSTSSAGDFVALMDMIPTVQGNGIDTFFVTIDHGSSNRNPGISMGVGEYGGWIIWSVWENNSTGVWKLYGSWVDIPTAVKDGPELPRTFSLCQNYPNPFNPSTTITYDLPHRTYVRLSIFDVLGRNLQTLVDGYQEAGSKTEVFDARNLSSGIYFYRLEADKFTTTRKMVLIR
ncbi:MAG TPA: T9SS type A sorting domain-containing protein [Bacteroidota bacterium]|nr:T9SS type A sorting domain-containing protein [Bacteroidota bacterium]